jgi:DNA primase
MAGMIRQSDVEEVKARTNLADVIADYVVLKPAGVGSLKGLCPFHEERSPSFNVRPQAGFYHCFGCGESGDVFTFLQRVEGLSFVECVERLAGRLGFPLTYEEHGGAKADRSGRARLLSAATAAEEFYRAALARPEAREGRRFLGGRAFDAEAARRFGVGYAPQGWQALTTYLRGRGYSDEELVQAGLASKGQRGIYDRFRGRIVWPIRDVTGQTVGFGARRLMEDDTGPKYLNTPETTVYHKSSVLYGLDLAKREIARTRRVVVVEGYTDVMACHLAGVTTAVATCGTAFGADHAAALTRLLGDDGSAEVIFTFDPDEAGQKAAVHAFSQSHTLAAQRYVAVGPGGLDPCDLRIHRGDQAVRDMIAAKRPLFDFMVRRILTPFDLDAADGRAAALLATAPVIASAKDPILRRAYVRHLAGLLGVDLEDAEAAVRRAGTHPRAAAPRVRPDARPSPQQAGGHAVPLLTSRLKLPGDPATKLVRDALQVILQRPDALAPDILGRALASRIDNPSLAMLRDTMLARAVGTLGPAWLDGVLRELPEEVRPLAQDLAAAPLPGRDADDVRAYCDGMARALIEHDVLRRRDELMRRLQRSDPGDAEGRRLLQRQIADAESERRRLRGE